MLSESVQGGTLERTRGTQVGLLFRVCPHVGVESATLRTSVLAEWTSERFLTCVFPDVDGEDRVVREALVAVGAHERSLVVFLQVVYLEGTGGDVRRA